MANEKDPAKETPKEDNKDALKPDKGTTNTTDPQENMEGPISSLVQGAKEDMEEKGAEKKEEGE
jgi:hypothetical protein